MSTSSNEQRRLVPLDREDLVSLLRSKPVSEWEQAVKLLTKFNLLFLPRDSYEGLGIDRPAKSDEDKARKLKGHLNRMAEQKAAKEAKRVRRLKAHELRMADQKAAKERRAERKVAHKQTVEKQKAEATARRGAAKLSAKTIVAEYREQVKQALAILESEESETVRTWLMTLPEHYRGRATGQRWVAKPPIGRDREWFFRNITDDEHEEVAEATIQAITLSYNACNHRLAVYFHERTGFAPAGPRTKGKVAPMEKTEDEKLKDARSKQEREFLEGLSANLKDFKDQGIL